MLLLRPGDYRSVWQRRAAARPGVISYDAVAQALVDSEVTVDLAEDPVPDTHLRRAVRDALDGVALSPFLLERFIEAFGLAGRHAQRLRQLSDGSHAVRVISGDALAPRVLYRDTGPAQHDTLSLHELHVLGPDGLPAEHETIQVIRSTVDDLVSFPYRFDTDQLMVEVVRGGRVGDEIYQVAEHIHAVDIQLNQPLMAGETALLQYHTTFFYRSAPPPEFRRGIMRSAEDLTMWVKFHPRRVPRRVWLAHWDRLDHSRVIDQHPAELDGELSVHARFGRVERAIVGFHWEWE
jgi:hypothetical protein